jgi:hypothetical protein
MMTPKERMRERTKKKLRYLRFGQRLLHSSAFFKPSDIALAIRDLVIHLGFFG